MFVPLTRHLSQLPPRPATAAAARRWLPDPFRPTGQLLLQLSDVWSAVVTGSNAEHRDMGLREAVGHLAILAPPWAAAVWRVVGPGAAVIVVLYGWRWVVEIGYETPGDCHLGMLQLICVEVPRRTVRVGRCARAGGLTGLVCCPAAGHWTSRLPEYHRV